MKYAALVWEWTKVVGALILFAVTLLLILSQFRTGDLPWRY